MHILTDWNNLSTQGFGGLHDCLKKELELYHTDISDSANISRTKGLLRRIEAMKWGPNNFVRDESVMREAQERMERFGVLTLTGVGAVGKTALASKLLAVSAKDDKFDRYITMSTKVNSDQGELDPDSQGITETNSGNSLFTTLLNSENKRISGSMNRLCRAIIRAVKTDYRYQGEGTETLIESAISTMKNNSMLIVIDNFEDIEAPSEHLAKTEKEKNCCPMLTGNSSSSKTISRNGVWNIRVSKIVPKVRKASHKSSLPPEKVALLTKSSNAGTTSFN